jgi:hypothetical protein
VREGGDIGCTGSVTEGNLRFVNKDVGIGMVVEKMRYRYPVTDRTELAPLVKSCSQCHIHIIRLTFGMD